MKKRIYMTFILCSLVLALEACGKVQDDDNDYESESYSSKERDSDSEDGENLSDKLRSLLNRDDNDGEESSEEDMETSQEKDDIGDDKKEEDIEESNKYSAYYIEYEVIPAYRQYAIDMGFDCAGLIYLDNDNVPEMVFDSGNSAGGAYICTYYDGVVYDQYMMEGYEYIEKQGLLYSPGGRNGYNWDNVIKLEDGEFCAVAHGEYNSTYDSSGKLLPESDYYWYYDLDADTGTKISEEQYEENLNQVFDMDKAIWSSKIDLYNNVVEAYENLDDKGTLNKYYDKLYNITELSLDNNILTVKNKDGDISLEVEISDDCNWYCRYTDVSVVDSSYDEMYSEWERTPKDLEEHHSPTVFGVIIENGVVMEVYTMKA